MKTFALICIALISITQIGAVNMRLREIPGFNKLEDVAMKSPYAARLISSLQIQLKEQGKVDEVIEQLHKALSDAIAEQDVIKNDWFKELSRLSTLIQDTQYTIDGLKIQQRDTADTIKNTENNIQFLQDEIEAIIKYLEELSVREENVETTRKNDADAFESRQRRDETTIGALEDIITHLEELRARGPAFLQQQQIDIASKLKRIPQGDKLAQFVEISSQFSEGALNMVIGKMSTLLEVTQKSKAEDEESERQSIETYKAVLQEMHDQRIWKNAKLHQDKSDLRAAQTNLDVLNQKLDALNENLESQEETLEASNALLAQEKAEFEAKLEDAHKSVEALKIAINFVEENAAALSK